MKVSHLVVAALSFSALTAFADDADLSGQFAPSVQPAATRAQVQSQLQGYRAAGVNPWSASFNPVKNFKSQTTRAQVNADYLASRNAVSAFTGEDSGSAYLAAHRGAADASRQLAGQPANAQ